MKILTHNDIDTATNTCINTDLKNNKAIIGITPDTLVIPKKLPIETVDDCDWLIEGKVKEGYTLIADAIVIQNVIDACYNAIETNTSYVIITTCGTVIKFN